MALVGDVDPAPLRAAGWRLRGALSGDPFGLPLEDAERAGAYTDVAELVDDALLDAVAVDGSDPGLAALLPELRAGGLLLLLPTAAPLEVSAVQAARAVPDAADTAVGLLQRWQPWARTVAAALPLVPGPLEQVTVRGWPRGPQAAAELVDLAASWCGEVVAVVAAPGPLPATALPDGASVSWVLLTAGGATVLVSHDGAQEVRLSGAGVRLEARPGSVRWTGGAELPLRPTSGARPGEDAGLVATAAALSAAVGGGDVATDAWPWPADLGDLLVSARVLEALRTSARTEQPVRVA